MINEEQAKELLKPLIAGCTITEVQDYGDVFAIDFVNDEYYNSKNIRDMAVGAGPAFVEKGAGKVTKTGSGLSTQQYVEAYRACGDFFASLGCSIQVSGNLSRIDLLKTALKVKNICGYSTLESKNMVSSVSEGGEVEVNFSTPSLASQALLKLQELGFKVRQSWESGQG